MTEVGTSLVRRNNASLLLYLPMIQWDLELFKMQTMKEGPLPHIAKYHVQQCLQVSQHYKQLCRNNTREPQVREEHVHNSVSSFRS